MCLCEYFYFESEINKNITFLKCHQMLDGFCFVYFITCIIKQVSKSC